jgi:hypothetical protein
MSHILNLAGRTSLILRNLLQTFQHSRQRDNCYILYIIIEVWNNPDHMSKTWYRFLNNELELLYNSQLFGPIENISYVG